MSGMTTPSQATNIFRRKRALVPPQFQPAKHHILIEWEEVTNYLTDRWERNRSSILKDFCNTLRTILLLLTIVRIWSNMVQHVVENNLTHDITQFQSGRIGLHQPSSNVRIHYRLLDNTSVRVYL